MGEDVQSNRENSLMTVGLTAENSFSVISFLVSTYGINQHENCT